MLRLIWRGFWTGPAIIRGIWGRSTSLLRRGLPCDHYLQVAALGFVFLLAGSAGRIVHQAWYHIINAITQDRSYHPHKITARRMIRYKIRPMTERTVEMVAQKPLLQALAVEDVETAQFADFLGAVHLV